MEWEFSGVSQTAFQLGTSVHVSIHFSPSGVERGWWGREPVVVESIPFFRGKLAAFIFTVGRCSGVMGIANSDGEFYR